jgi:hypothetical protein
MATGMREGRVHHGEEGDTEKKDARDEIRISKFETNSNGPKGE